MRGVVAAALTAAAIAAPSGAATHLLVISGLGGEESFSTSFHDWSVSLAASAVASGVPDSNVLYLAEDPARDPERIDGESRKETIDATLRKLGESAGADGELWIVIFGHGSARGSFSSVRSSSSPPHGSSSAKPRPWRGSSAASTSAWPCSARSYVAISSR